MPSELVSSRAKRAIAAEFADYLEKIRPGFVVRDMAGALVDPREPVAAQSVVEASDTTWSYAICKLRELAIDPDSIPNDARELDE